MTKEAFNRKISLLTIKLNIEFRKELIRSNVWKIAMYSLETWRQKIGTELIGELRNVILEDNGEDKMVRYGKDVMGVTQLLFHLMKNIYCPCSC